MSETNEREEKKEERQEESLERRLERRFTRRELRREHRLETVIPEDRFTKTADFVSAIITGEIIASKITGEIPGAAPEEEPHLFGDRTGFFERRQEERREVGVTSSSRAERIQSKITDEVNYTIQTQYYLIDSSTHGVCSEIAIRSPSTSFSVSVIIDDIKQFDRTYSQFATLSPHSDLIDAFEDSQSSGVYVLHIGELNWRRKCQAILTVLEEITFENIFVNIKEYLI